MSNSSEKRFKFSMNILTIVLVAALFLCYAIYARLNRPQSDHFQIHIVVPWGLMAIFISFYLFREFNRVKKAKREERREYLNQRRQELLDNVLKKNKETKNE